MRRVNAGNVALVILGVIGWLLSYSYIIHLVGPYADTCNQGDDSPYQLSVILGPATLAVASGLIWAGHSAAGGLRWFILPHLATLAFAVMILAPYFVRCTIEGYFICAGNGYGDDWLAQGSDTVFWHRLYAPIHILSLAAFFYSCFKFWFSAQSRKTWGKGPPATNPESWANMVDFVGRFPNNATWKRWKVAIVALLQMGRKDGLDEVFRAGQSMQHLIFSTHDHHGLEDTPGIARVTVAHHSPAELEISYGHGNRWFGDPKHAEIVSGDAAYPVLKQYLRLLWLETKDERTLPAVLKEA